MFRMTFINTCVILYLIKSVITSDNTDDFLTISKATKYNIRQVQNLPENFFDFTNVDTQFLYSHVKRRSPESEPEGKYFAFNPK